MAVAIRLQRIGKHKQAYFRVVAVDRRRAAQGKPIEILGSYNPRALKTKDKVVIQKERYDYWIGVGAKPSETVQSLLKGAARSVEKKRTQRKTKKQLAKLKAEKKPAEEAKASEKPAEGAKASEAKGAAKEKSDSKPKAKAEKKAEPKAEKKAEAKAEKKPEKKA